MKEYADILRVEGIMSEGFGINPKAVMRDRRLTIEAKAIYAYLSSFAGSGSRAFPARDLMLEELGISKDRYYKHLDLLIQCDYIRIERSTNGNIRGKNTYVIVARPDPDCDETAGKAESAGDTGRPAGKRARQKLHAIEKSGAEELRERLGIDALKKQLPDESQLIETIFMAAEDILTSEEISIAGSVKKKGSMSGVLSKLNSDNIRSVLHVLRKNKSKIYNRKAYIQTCLINSFYEIGKPVAVGEGKEEEDAIKKERQEREHKNKLYSRCPELKQLDGEIQGLYVQLTRFRLQNKKDEESTLKRRIEERNKRKELLMDQLGAKDCS